MNMKRVYFTLMELSSDRSRDNDRLIAQVIAAIRVADGDGVSEGVKVKASRVDDGLTL